MTIRVDQSTANVVVICTQCPSWAHAVDTRAAAWRQGASHEERVHPTSLQARKTFNKIDERARK